MRTARRVVRRRRDRILPRLRARARRRRVVQVPHEAMKAGRGGQHFRRTNPVRRRVAQVRRRHRRVAARVARITRPLESTISSFASPPAFRAEVVVDDRAVGRILRRTARRAASACRCTCSSETDTRVAGANSVARARRRARRICRSGVMSSRIQNDAPVRADGDVVVLDHEIANRRRRHVEPQRLPMVAVVERDPHLRLACRRTAARGASDPRARR